MEVIKDNSVIKHLRFSYSGFLHHAEFRTKSEKAVKGGYSDSTMSGEWSGTESFEEALSFGKEGWDSGLEQLKLEDGVLADSGMEFTPSVLGPVVNMGAYLQGLPVNMYQMKEEREYNLEEFTFYVNLTYNAGVDVERAMRFCQSINEIVNEKQKNYNVRIIGFIDSKQGGGFRYVTEVLVKDFDERFVLNNVAFCFHPSFFRRLWFSHLEGEECIASGYGTQTSHERFKTFVRKNHKGEGCFTPFLNDLSEGGFNKDKLDKF